MIVEIKYILMESLPIDKIWRPVATCYLQQAEYDCFVMVDTHYHQRATKIGKSIMPALAYSQDDAQTLIANLRRKHPYAKFYAMGCPIVDVV